MLANLLAALIITVVIQSPEQVQSSWEARGNDSRVSGWATWEVPSDGSSVSPRNCIIHVPELTIVTFYIWLHEIKHCQDGDFHS